MHSRIISIISREQEIHAHNIRRTHGTQYQHGHAKKNAENVSRRACVHSSSTQWQREPVGALITPTVVAACIMNALSMIDASVVVTHTHDDGRQPTETTYRATTTTTAAVPTRPESEICARRAKRNGTRHVT